MDTTKLKQIIADKNDRLEREAVRTVEGHIERIIVLQRQMREAEAEIARLRQEIKALEVEQLDSKTLLNED